MKGNQHQARTIDEVFEAQRNRVRQNLRYRIEHFRERMDKLGLGELSVEVHGTSGGGPSNRSGSDERTSEYRLYGGS